MNNQVKIGDFDVININELNPSDINRAIDNAHVIRFQNKLSKNNWLDPIKVDNQYNILEGHHRYYAALNMKLKRVPIYIASWLHNLTEKERLGVILEYNASNLNWTNEDYLEKYSEIDNSYNYVYNKWKNFKSNLSTGTILNIYMNYNKSKFTKGECLLRTGKLPEHLAVSLSKIVEKYGKSLAQSYCLREVVKVCQATNSIVASNYILDRYEDMLKGNHAKLTSIRDFRPHINDIKSQYISIVNG